MPEALAPVAPDEVAVTRAAAATSGRIVRGAPTQASSGTVRERGRNRSWAVVAVLTILDGGCVESRSALRTAARSPGSRSTIGRRAAW